MLLTLLEVYILAHCDPPSTGRIQQLSYNTNHKQGTRKLLNKYLLFTNGDFWEWQKLFDFIRNFE